MKRPKQHTTPPPPLPEPGVVPSWRQFKALAQPRAIIPIMRTLMADEETPVSIYQKLMSLKPPAKARPPRYGFLLESVEGEEKLARYSLIGVDPEAVFVFDEKTLTRATPSGDKQLIETYDQPYGNPFPALKRIMKEYRPVGFERLPVFWGGLVGYCGYDMVRCFERLTHRPKKVLPFADMVMMLVKDMVIYDHHRHMIEVLACVHCPSRLTTTALKRLYEAACERIETTVAAIRRSACDSKSTVNLVHPPPIRLTSNISRQRFYDMVKRAKRFIRAGDIIQVVLSQRFDTHFKTSAFDAYRALRLLNPSPYLFYLQLGPQALAGSSPELLVRCEDGYVHTRPIAGTRPRGTTLQQDERLAEDLLNDPKERAEHIMLVDLGRNDLGRVCLAGTVRVTELMRIEKYSHVMHIVSHVMGRLNPRYDAFDVLQAAFPAGTVTGAPKIRAMEIIDALEPEARGPYAGCVGYIGFNGVMDTCITIRTIAFHNGQASIQAGAGIVADSKPVREYEETLNKARAQAVALKKSIEISKHLI